MGVSEKTRKMLWGRAANRCSIPECRKVLVQDETDLDDPSIIGDEAHIVSRKTTGPRGDYALDVERRDDFVNMILLCKEHHKIIDDQPASYTVEMLRTLKAQHQKWVEEILNTDKAKQGDEEVYDFYIDCWLDLGGIDEWEDWSSWVFWANGPRLDASRLEQFEGLVRYLDSRIWLGRYPELEDAFKNFASILKDFNTVFMMHAQEVSTGAQTQFWTERFYKLGDYDEGLYKQRLAEYNYHVKLVLDLMLELTRAANRICDQVRRHISRTFRIEEGAIMVMSGFGNGITQTCERTDYSGLREDECTYPGLRQFMVVRTERDRYFGEGVSNLYI